MTDAMRSTRDNLSSSAAPVASTAKDRTADVAATAGDELRATTREAKDHARDLVNQTRDQLRSQASDQTSRLAGSMREMSQQLDSLARGDGAAPGMVSDVVNQLASTVRRGAERLESGGFDATVADLKRYARRRPGMFLLGAVGAGFVAGRLVKAVDTHAVMDAARNQGDSSDMGSGNGQGSGYGFAGNSTTAMGSGGNGVYGTSSDSFGVSQLPPPSTTDAGSIPSVAPSTVPGAREFESYTDGGL